MTPTHRVKEGFEISVNGVTYGPGAEVALTPEEAEGIHKPYVESLKTQPKADADRKS